MCRPICAGECGAITNDLVYNNATLALKAFSDGACVVVADSIFHNLTVGEDGASWRC